MQLARRDSAEGTRTGSAVKTMSPTTVIPEEFMHPSKKKEVLAFLIAAPAERKLKSQLLLGWAQEVGLRLRQRDYLAVMATAIDN